MINASMTCSQARRAISALLLATSLLAVALYSHATSSDEQAALDYLKTSFSEVDINRISRISREMSLDEKTAHQFWPRYQDYLHRQIALRDKQLATLTSYASHQNKRSLDQAIAADMLRTSMANEEKRLVNGQNLIKNLKGTLTPTQQMRLYQIELLIDAQIRAGLLTQIPLVE